MKRAVKINLSKFATKDKLRKLDNLFKAYRSAVNFFIKSLWVEQGKLDKATLARLQNTRLSERFKSQALKQAIEIIISTKKSAKALKHYASMPIFNGAMILDAKFIALEPGKNSFDLWLKISTLKKGKRTWLPLRKTKVLNKWLSVQNAKLVQGAGIKKDKFGKWFAIIWVSLPDKQPKNQGDVVGLDFGFNKLIALSTGVTSGGDIKRLCKKAAAKKQGSKAKQRTRSEIRNYINRQLKLLPFSNMRVLVIEDLRNIKQGKKKNRSKKFRRNLSTWTIGYAQRRIKTLTEENRVLLGLSNPYKSSQKCSVCGCVDRNNRNNERFLCTACGHADDADTNAARNHRSYWLASLESAKTAENHLCNNSQRL